LRRPHKQAAALFPTLSWTEAYSALLNGARLGTALVNGSAYFFVRECRNDTLDLPPMAESLNIARVAAFLGASRRLQPGVIAEAIDQV